MRIFFLLLSLLPFFLSINSKASIKMASSPLEGKWNFWSQFVTAGPLKSSLYGPFRSRLTLDKNWNLNHSQIELSGLFAKQWGQVQFDSGRSGGTIARNTSGNRSKHSPLGISKANWSYFPTHFLNFKIGRQHLSYGEGLFLGTDDSDLYGNSFDAIKVQFKWWHSKLDILYLSLIGSTKITDNYDQHLLATAYYQYERKISSFLPEKIHIFLGMEQNDYQYPLNQTLLESTGNAPYQNYIGGLHLKWSFFKYLRFKFDTVVNIRNLDVLNYTFLGRYYQAQLEYNFNNSDNLQLSYFRGNQHTQKYWGKYKAFWGQLGLFGPRNLNGLKLKLKKKWQDIDFSASLYSFYVSSANDTPYDVQDRKWTTQTYGHGKKLGQELDLDLTYRFTHSQKVSVAYQLFHSSGQIRKVYDQKWQQTIVLNHQMVF